MKRWVRTLLVVWLMAFPGSAALAQTDPGALEVGASATQHTTLLGYLSYLEDPTRELGIADAVRAAQIGRFTLGVLSADRMDFGITRSAYWLRLTLRNSGAHKVLRTISFPLAHTDRIELHRPQRRGAVTPMVTGLMTPMDERPYSHWQPVLSLELEPGTTETIYLRITSRQRLTLRAELWDETSMHAAMMRNSNITLLLTGWMGALVVFHLVLFLVLRDSIYGYYAGYGVGMILFQGVFNGSMHAWLLMGHSEYGPLAFSLPLTLLVASIVQFVRRYLALAIFLPRLDRLCQIFAWAFAIVMPLHTLITGEFTVFGQGMTALAGIFVIGVETYAVARRVPYSIPVLVSWMPAIPLFAEILLALFDFIAWPENPTQMLSLGAAAELTLLTHAVLWRFIKMRRSNRDAQARALQAADARLQVLREAERELEARVQQRSRELERTREQLTAARDMAEQASHAKQRFLANMSHEIRTPLNAMLGMSYLASQYPMEEPARAYLDKSSAAAQSLLGLINDILDASRLEAGKMVLEVIPYSVRQLLQELVKQHAPQAEQGGLALELEVAADVPDALIGDAQKLTQVLGHVLSNAIKFTHKGSVVVHVSRSPRSDNYVGLKIEVRDTGIGMAEEQMAAVFSPFAQADSSITRHHDGVGLGLRIAHGMAELMGGELTVTSEVGRGSTLTLCVPMVQQIGAQADAP